MDTKHGSQGLGNLLESQDWKNPKQRFGMCKDVIPTEHTAANYMEYGIGTQILKNLGINKFRVITQNPEQKPLISGYGVEVAEMVSLV